VVRVGELKKGEVAERGAKGCIEEGRD